MMSSSMVLLLIDQDEVDREVVRRLLPAACTIHEAATGTNTLALAKTQVPACVLLEWRLPGIAGWQ